MYAMQKTMYILYSKQLGCMRGGGGVEGRLLARAIVRLKDLSSHFCSSPPPPLPLSLEGGGGGGKKSPGPERGVCFEILRLLHWALRCNADAVAVLFDGVSC